MSYSICLNCLKTVHSVEKYCAPCVERWGLKQDLSWHARHRFPGDDMERKEIVNADRPKPAPPKLAGIL